MSAIGEAFKLAGVNVRRDHGDEDVLCPFHEDTRPSCSINHDRDCFICHACGKQGGVKAALLHHFDGDEEQARATTRILLKPNGGSVGHAGNGKPRTAKPRTAQPEPACVPESQLPPGTYWEYENRDYEPVCRVYRKADAEGKKRYQQWRKTPEGWQPKAPTDKILYRLPDILGARHDDVIVVCEGEKCADALHYSDIRATTWLGGAKASKRTSFHELHNRKVIIWPDNDDDGRHAARLVARELWGKAQVRIVDVQNKPEGWDAADAKDEGIDLREYIRHHLVKPEEYFNRESHGEC